VDTSNAAGRAFFDQGVVLAKDRERLLQFGAAVMLAGFAAFETDVRRERHGRAS